MFLRVYVFYNFGNKRDFPLSYSRDINLRKMIRSMDGDQFTKSWNIEWKLLTVVLEFTRGLNLQRDL